MRVRRIVGILLIAGGVLALVYGGFSFTTQRHAVEIGQIRLGVSKQESMNVPTWAGVLAIAGGTLFLLVGDRRG